VILAHNTAMLPYMLRDWLLTAPSRFRWDGGDYSIRQAPRESTFTKLTVARIRLIFAG